MKHSNLEHHHHVMRCLSSLPKHIVSLHGEANIPEFVLHDLCHEQCLNLPKAAYFVDNPDFNCMKGVVGICKDDVCTVTNAWSDPSLFSETMTRSPFNQQVRQLIQESPHHNNIKDDIVVAELAQALGIEQPEYHVWPMKHDNHGYLVYQKGEGAGLEELIAEHLPNGVHFLSLCPIF